MTPVQVKQLAMLAGLGAVLATVVVVQRGAVTAPDAAAGAPAAAQGRPVPLVDPAVVDLRLEALSAARMGHPESVRNPFRFRARVEPVQAAAAAARRRAAASAPPPIPVRPEATGPPPPPPIALRFIGLVDPAGSDARAAIFSDMRGNVFNGREGDIIEGRYRVVRVGLDAAELVYLDGRGRQTIRLSGQ